VDSYIHQIIQEYDDSHEFHDLQIMVLVISYRQIMLHHLLLKPVKQLVQIRQEQNNLFVKGNVVSIVVIRLVIIQIRQYVYHSVYVEKLVQLMIC
jgi:hypothetical protein